MYFIYLNHYQTDITFFTFHDAEKAALEMQTHGCIDEISIYFDEELIINFLPMQGVA